MANNKAFKVKNGLELDAYNKSISDTAVDVFVYDTSKDSDGGAWRHRCQHTSWYNETLNTSTRGSRREFPAVAVIVAESNKKLTIYDGDDPTLPMWMIFNKNSSGWPIGNYLGTTDNINAISALNGWITLGNSGVGVIVIDFLSDKQMTAGASTYQSNLPISGRNTAVTLQSGTFGAIINNTVNDVAMTVLPNAPIDPATGLPVPTIAVATAGGVSVIKDDGTVVDITGYTYAPTKIAIEGNTLWNSHTTADGTLYAGPLVFNADTTLTSWRYAYYNKTVAAALATLDVDSLSIPAVGGSDGISLLAENLTTPANGMVAYTTSSYNTGWMPGDIKLATLSDTDATNATGSELVTNGDFGSDISGWANNSAGSASISWNASGYLNLNGAADGRAIATQAVTTAAGKVYSLTVTDEATVPFSVVVGTSSGGNQLFSGSDATGDKSVTFTATGSTSYVSVRSRQVAETAIVDNISVRLAEPDRSVNGKGLQVFGTITKSAVATGADLVAYSGFSGSNYLQQPYNSDLNFGTGDFFVMAWVKLGSSGTQFIIDRQNGGGISTDRLNFAIIDYSSNLFCRVDNNTVTVSKSLPQGVWLNLALVRQSGVAYFYVDGVLVGSGAQAGNNTDASASYPLTVFAQGSDKLYSPSAGCLLRISATAPTAEQIAKIYEDEKFLFQDGAQATLYGSSDAVTALAYDSDTELLHVGTSAGRSVFQGLRRVDNTTTAVGAAISASNGMVAED